MLRSARASIATTIAWLIAVPLAAQVRPLTRDPEAAPARIEYSVIYTGRLFGYFRFPSEQDDALRQCSDVKEAASGPAATSSAKS